MINWHLGLSARERIWQTRHLLQHALYRESIHLPTLLIGDSNDWRNRLWKKELEVRDYQLVTRPISRYRTYPATLPMGALDKAYCLGNIKVRACTIVRDKSTRTASDHLPLLVDLHLEADSAANAVGDAPQDSA